MAKNAGVILKLLLKAQNTKPCAGRPHAARPGAAAMSRRVSLG